MLTVADYRATGGLNAAVQRTAEELYAALDRDHQQVAHDLFLRLVTIDDDVALTRRRIPRTELGLDAHEVSTPVREVVDRFAERRLLTLTAESVEVSHEALLTAWPRLRGWLAADRAGLLVHRRITAGAYAWDAAARDPSALVAGVALEAALEWAAELQNRRRMNPVEQEYLDAALHRRDELERIERRHARRLVQLLVAVAVLALVASGLAIRAGAAQRNADRARRVAATARDQALSRQVAIQARELAASDPALAQQLAVAGYRISSTVESRSELIDVAASPVLTRVLGVAGPTPLTLSAGGTAAVGHADDGSVHLMTVSGGRPVQLGVVPGEKQQLFALAFSPNGRVLATGGAARDVALWDVHDPRRVHLLSRLTTGFTAATQSLAFSPDGTRLLAGGDGTRPLVEWRVGDPAHVTAAAPPRGLPPKSTVQSVAFDPGGGSVAAATAAGEVWDWAVTRTTTARTPRVGSVSRTDHVGLNAVAFAPRSHQLVTGARDGHITIWNTAGARLSVARALPGNSDGQINVLSFSADGSRLLSGSSDNSVRQWDTSSWSALATTPAPGPVTGVAFSADGSSVYVTAADGVLLRWSTAEPQADGGSGTVFSLGWTGNGKELAVGRNGPEGGVQLWDTASARALRPVGPKLSIPGANPVDGTSAISRDGRVVAAGNSAGRVAVWDTRDPAHPKEVAGFTASTALIEGVALNPDGSLLAVGGDDNAVSLWNLRDPARPVRVARMQTKNLVLSVAFSPDGQLLAAAVGDRTARLWDVRSPSAPRADAVLGGFGTYVYGVAFSPNGHVLAASSADRTTRLWSITHPRRPKQLGPALRGPTDYENIPSFDASGHLLAVPSNDHTVWVYDVGRPAQAQVLATLRSIDGNVFTSAFSPVGRLLAAGGRSDSAPVWSIDPAADARLVCAGAGDPITRTEWRQYVPGAAYDPPCR